MTLNEFRTYARPVCQSAKRFNKVFGIGANKTGTTTLETLFYLIGLDIAPQAQTELASIRCHHGDLSTLTTFMRPYDAF